MRRRRRKDGGRQAAAAAAAAALLVGASGDGRGHPILPLGPSLGRDVLDAAAAAAAAGGGGGGGKRNVCRCCRLGRGQDRETRPWRLGRKKNRFFAKRRKGGRTGGRKGRRRRRSRAGRRRSYTIAEVNPKHAWKEDGHRYSTSSKEASSP
jgi:hypothetical protein